MTVAYARARSPLAQASLFGLAALVITILPAHLRWTPFNNYVVLADAFLHGHIWVAWPNVWIDAVESHGRHYIVNDPVPSLLLLPYVFFAGITANQTLLDAPLAFAAAFAAWRIGANLGVPPRRAVVICAFMFAGTDLWWASTIGDVWFLAQTSAVAFVLLAFVELTGSKPKGWLVGVLFMLAVGSRFTVAMAVPAIAYFVWAGNVDPTGRDAEGRAKRLTAFLGVVAGYFILWMGYNYARWGVVWDAGHPVFYHQDVGMGGALGSPFGLHNLKMQIRSFFIAPPHFTSTFPYLIPSTYGTALTWTSPALVFAFWARRPTRTVAALWLATMLVAAPNFLYYVNGYLQFGMRHALDFEPFLFVLMLIASRESLPKWLDALVLCSIAASAYGVWYWVSFVTIHRLP